MARVIPRHQRATRRSANRIAGITLREARAFFRQFINVRRLNEFLSVATDVAVARSSARIKMMFGFSAAKTAFAQKIAKRNGMNLALRIRGLCRPETWAATFQRIHSIVSW